MFDNFGEVFFRLLNFGLVIFLCAYAFKKYLLRGLLAKIQAYHLYVNNLEKTRLERIASNATFHSLLGKQEQEIVTLEQKLVRWQQAREQAVKAQQEYYAAITIRIQQKRAVQQDNLSLILARKEIIPHAFAQVTEELTKQCAPADSLLHQEYLHQLITFMKKSTP